MRLGALPHLALEASVAVGREAGNELPSSAAVEAEAEPSTANLGLSLGQAPRIRGCKCVQLPASGPLGTKQEASGLGAGC